MQQGFVVGCFFLTTSVMGPIVWHLWIYSRSANANFYFGVTLAFATAQVSMTFHLFYHMVYHKFKNEFKYMIGAKLRILINEKILIPLQLSTMMLVLNSTKTLRRR